jgi:hypothetical protein
VIQETGWECTREHLHCRFVHSSEGWDARGTVGNQGGRDER